jgi:SAM-dependent methyltransferase
MDDNSQMTLATYNKIAKDWHKANASVHFWDKYHGKFKKLLPKGKILELGSGAGRDSFWFLENNYEYLGIDASESMIKLAKENNPQASFEVKNFSEIGSLGKKFNGFWAAASLVHTQKENIGKILTDIKKILETAAIGFISLKKGIGEKNEIWKSSGLTRFFAYYQLDEFNKILLESGFKVLEAGEYVSSKDSSTVWLTFFVTI